MGLRQWLLIGLFLVQVKVPMGLKVTYDNVKKFHIDNGAYCLILETGERVWVPVAFTIIKEKHHDKNQTKKSKTIKSKETL